jgi:hypothetical protein
LGGSHRTSRDRRIRDCREGTTRRGGGLRNGRCRAKVDEVLQQLRGCSDLLLNVLFALINGLEKGRGGVGRHEERKRTRDVGTRDERTREKENEGRRGRERRRNEGRENDERRETKKK